jgi:hypothetical protein
MSGIHHRKNINCLSSDELHNLREAFAAMYQLPASNPHSFAKQASFHGGPPTAYCRHGAPGFFTWHRAELKAFEDALRAVGCHIALPFWDWSSGPTTGIPSACRNPTYVNRAGSTVPNPLYAGPRASGGMTTRSASVSTASFGDLATSVQAAMSETSFATFQSLINGPHGSVHVRVGGDMGSVPTASYDPIFYFHHANVDRIWARWQLDHPGSLPAAEANFELPPFTRPFTTSWQRGSDVESTDALGYRYRTWCLVLPPFRVWEVVRVELPFPIERVRGARLVARTARMQAGPVEVRVFVNRPDANGRTPTAGDSGFAGAFGFIGMGPSRKEEAAHCPKCAELGHPGEHASHQASGEKKHAGHEHGQEPGHGHHPAPVGVEERFDVAVHVSDALIRAGAGQKDITLKLVAVDAEGNELSPDVVRLDGVDLEVE